MKKKPKKIQIKRLTINNKKNEDSEKKTSLFEYIRKGFAIIIFIILLYLSYIIIIDPLEDFKFQILKEYSVTIVPIVFLYSITMFVFFYFFYILLYHYIKDFSKYFWKFVMIALMFFIVINGYLIISNIYGEHDLKLKLRGENNEEIGWISCLDHKGRNLVGSEYTCEITETILSNSSITAIFVDKYGNANSSILPTNRFIAPPKTFRVGFEVEGITFDGTNYKKFKGSSYWFYTFYTEEEKQQRYDTFVAYLLALLGITVFSIPPFIVNLKEA